MVQRKTNIFYNTNDKTKFVTFSNYTESMTGNFVATDTKLFPSKFLCLYIPKLEDVNEKLTFINNYLCGWYENKLAYLRDFCNNENLKPSEYIYPLYYLMDIIYKYDNDAKINYVNDITEQDYNGTFTDTICVIDGNTIYNSIDINVDLFLEEKDNEITYKDFKYPDELKNYVSNFLWGWYDYSTNESPLSYKKGFPYVGLVPMFDNINNYYYKFNNQKNNNLNLLKYNKQTSNDIKFNVIIPLYDVMDFNYNTNNDILGEEDYLYGNYNINVPLGMWFANETIVLKRSNEDIYIPSWSLTIASQFKPFPYMSNMPNELSAEANTQSFNTFSQILTRQNEILNTVNKFSYQLADINNRFVKIEAQLKNIGTTYNIDGLHKEMLTTKKEIDNRCNELENTVMSYIKNYKWIYSN